MGRTNYVIKRTLFAIVAVFIALTINFAIFRSAPGDPTSNFAEIPGFGQEQIAALRVDFGLDKPIHVQYWLYLKQLSNGNLGFSFQNRQPVSEILKTAYLNSLPMVFLGSLFAIALGVTAGAVAARWRGRWPDHAILSTSLIFYALPTQWLGLMLLLLFSGKLPSGGRSDPFIIDPTFAEHMVDLGRHIILPSLTLGLVLLGSYTIVVRTALLETLSQDFVLTARAKGLSDWTIIRTHALRNALLPVTTLVGLSLGFLVAGSLLVETVFSWPGIGRAIYQAAFFRDYPMLQGAFLILTVSVVLANLIVDLIYFKLDPRVRT